MCGQTWASIFVAYVNHVSLGFNFFIGSTFSKSIRKPYNSNNLNHMVGLLVCELVSLCAFNFLHSYDL